MSDETIFMPCAEFERFAAAAFRAAGVPERDAKLCAQVLIAADRRGVSSHGIGRITGHYLDRIRNGIQQAATEVEFVRKVGATCVIDGHHGMGMVIAEAAMRYAMDRAREHGIGIAVVRNSTHFGIAGFYTEMAAANGMIGICGTNARPAVAPTFSTENMLGTNPLAWAMPSDDPFPFSFDGATCVAPQGKIELYERLGKSAIPSGWVIGEDGNYRTDVARINSDIPLHKAALVPIGGVGEEHGGRANLAVYSGGVASVEADQLVYYFAHKWIGASGSTGASHFNNSLKTYMIAGGGGNEKYVKYDIPDPGAQ